MAKCAEPFRQELYSSLRGILVIRPAIPGMFDVFLAFSSVNDQRPEDLGWSRREELNAPSAEYDSAALALSYTGFGRCLKLYHFARTSTPSAITFLGRIPTRPRWSFVLRQNCPQAVSGT